MAGLQKLAKPGLDPRSDVRIYEDDTVKLWSIVSGTVEKVTLHAIIVNVDVKGLSVVIKSVLKPGYMFEDILVLVVFIEKMLSYALSPNDGSECRVRIQSEAEHDFKDVSTMTPGMQIARS
ncbi:hypothetical protein L2E82_13203 [Cichorium intybus]|uniref:Uncharacterized protein n=1 Tax=Cichorium intybus TaxID=13427 RepID=A0ACB9GI81_CICIN|nr:hypothetical protein L2E82_13203 [Cichorium intybus]